MEEKILSKDDISGIEDLPVQEVYVPEWKGGILVRGLSAEERDSFEISITVDGKITYDNFKAKFVSFCIVDREGKRLFDDYRILAKKSATAIGRIFDVTRKLSGMTSGDVEEMLKNSESGQPG